MFYQLAVIGAGPAGYFAALKAAGLGVKTLLIEKEHLGGTCFNKGCIPAKFIINSIGHLSFLNKTVSAGLTLDYQKVFQEKNSKISSLNKAMLEFLKKSRVDIMFGRASISDNQQVEVNGESIQADNILIACGSKPSCFKGIPENKILFAEDFLSSKNIPDFENILIIGAGAIGIEMAFVFKHLGRKVTIVEREENILPFMDREISRRYEILLKQEGITVFKGKSFEDLDLNVFDKILVSVGRKPDSLGLPEDFLTSRGWVKAGPDFKVADRIYACGDILGRDMFAYTAQRQAEYIIGSIFDKQDFLYNQYPICVFGLPQIAKVGLTQEQADEKGISYRVRKIYFRTSSSSLVYGDESGFGKIIIGENGQILGAHLISCLASELISFYTLAVNKNLTLKDLKEILLIHPTLSETAVSL